MVERELGHGFIAVPYEAVCLNALYLRRLNTVDELPARFCVIPPQGCEYGTALQNEDGRPYLYTDIQEALDDVETLWKYPEFGGPGVSSEASVAEEPLTCWRE